MGDDGGKDRRGQIWVSIEDSNNNDGDFTDEVENIIWMWVFWFWEWEGEQKEMLKSTVRHQQTLHCEGDKNIPNFVMKV